MKKTLSKVLITFLIIVILANGFFLSKKARAMEVQDILLEETNLAYYGSYQFDTARSWTETIKEWGETALQWADNKAMFLGRWAEEDMMKSVRDIIAKKIMDYVVNETVKWIQGGGSPKFVSDWSGFAKDVGNIAFDTVINKVRLARLCSPFDLQVKLSLLPVQTFPVQISCTLDQFVSNIKNFYVDFSQGGWSAYAAEWEPNNNYYGQMLMIQDQIQIETSKKMTAAANEALSGSGYLSVKKCVEWNNEGYQMCVASGLLESECKKASCIKEEIQTPGAAVGAAVATSITSDTQWAANIQSWTAALVNAVINRVITQGFLGIQSAISGSGNEGTNYAVPDYQGQIQNEAAKQKVQLGLQNFLYEEQYLLNTKNRSLNAYQMQLVYLQQNCGSVTTAINNASANINRLNSETAVLQVDVNEINSAINAINLAAPATDLSQGTLTTSAVYDKYNTPAFGQQISSGSARQAADQEAVAAQTARDAAQAGQCN